MKKWLLILGGVVVCASAVIALLWWKSRLSQTVSTITTSYGLTATLPGDFRNYDASTIDFLNDSGQTFVRCVTPNTTATDICPDELSISLGMLDLTALDVNKVQMATGIVIPEDTISFDLSWLLTVANDDTISQEETMLTVSGLPASGVLITNTSPNIVEYYIRIEHPTKPIGIGIVGRGSEAQNVKTVSEAFLQSITISDL